MSRVARRAALTVALISLALSRAHAQTSPSASETWLLYERGNAAMSQGEYGTALRLFKQAIEGAGIFPEAELAVGDVYSEEGEPDLAIAQYEKAYNQRKSFTVPEMQYDALEKMAAVYESQEKYRLMEDKLTLIVQDDPRFAETESYRLRSQVVKNFIEKGIDRVLVLYTFDSSFTAAAHAKLGWFYYRTGRYDQAVEHLLYAVVYRASQVISYLHDRDVEYSYTSLPDLLSSIAAVRDLSDFAASSDFYRTLYYLAAASFATGGAQRASDLWQVLAGTPSAGQYQGLAASQLRKPFVEPLLTLTTGPTR